MVSVFWLYCRWCEERKIEQEFAPYCCQDCKDRGLAAKAEGKSK